MRKLTAGTALLLASLLPVAAAAQQFTMKIGFPTIHSGMENWAGTFKEAVEKRSAGRIRVEIFPGGQLGTVPATIQGIQLGTIEMTQSAPEALTGVDPRFDILSAPGLFEGLAHAHRALHDAEFKKGFWSLLDGKAMKIVGFACEAQSDYATNQPVTKLADFKGRKIRVLGSKLEVEIMRRLGATGVPMQLVEALPALQQKTIDGVRAGITVIVPFKYEGVARHVVRTGESVICPVKVVSRVWFERLPADLQAIVLEEAARADDANISWNLQFVDRMYASWLERGGTLAELPGAERAELRNRLRTVGDDVFKDVPAMQTAYELLKAAAGRTRK